MTNFHQFGTIWHALIIFQLTASFPCCKRGSLKGDPLKSETPEISDWKQQYPQSGRQDENFKLCFLLLLKMFSENEK